MTVQITPEQQQILMDSLRDRIGKLYDIAFSYKGNTEAKKDCLAEKRRVEQMLETVKNWEE